MLKLIRLSVIVLLLLPALYVFSEEEQRFNTPIDVMATGGAGVAGYNRFGEAWMNPASKAVPDFSRVAILEIGAGLGFGISPFDLFLLTNFYKNGNFSFDISNLSAEMVQKVLAANPQLSIAGPLRAGWYGKQLSILLSDDVHFGFSPRLSTGVPYLDVGLFVDVALQAGYGFEIPIPIFLGKFNKVYAGIDLKLIDRTKIDYRHINALELADRAALFTEGKEGVLNGLAFGSDIGALMKDDQLAFGLVIRDWFTTPFFWTEYVLSNSTPVVSTNKPETTFFLPSVDIGASYRIKELVSKWLLSDLMVYADLNDIFNFSQNYFQRLRLGAEVTAFMFLKLRVGLLSGYPTAGIGIDVPGLKINATYYAEELGIYPGSRPQQHLMLNLQIAI